MYFVTWFKDTLGTLMCGFQIQCHIIIWYDVLSTLYSDIRGTWIAGSDLRDHVDGNLAFASNQERSSCYNAKKFQN